ncbi:MAG: YciI family protein [Chloroflexota bacterium]|nr:YciI family protein [Chloroflexota bacterium]
MAEYIYMIKATRAGFATEPMAEEMEAMGKHFLYLKKLVEEKKAFMAGPCLDAAFGIVIYEADSEEEARRIMENDPSVIAGVMSAEMHEFRVSLLQEGYVPLKQRKVAVAVG